MSAKNIFPGYHQITRHDGVFQERIHDTYQTKGKPSEPSICPQCGAVFHEGRWQWIKSHATTHQHSCPACQRIHENNPAGFVTLHGDFFMHHRDEILNLARHVEEREKTEHPLKRIMATEEKDNAVLITTTDIHLARGIGTAIHAAYQGELEFHYTPSENLLRVHWSH